MRQEVLSLREAHRGRRPGSLGEAREFLRRHRTAWIVGAGGAVLLGGVGAFGTGSAAPWTLYSYWLVLMSLGAAAAAATRDGLDAQAWLAARPGLRRVLLVVVPTALMAPPVWFMAALAMDGSWSPWRMVELLPQVLLVMTVLVGLLSLLAQRQAPAPAGEATQSPAPARPPLRRRLPAPLADAEIYAVQAEDHYLRFHTDRGSALLLMRFSDALAELGGSAGARTHRSWWVARGAVVGATRGRGRATLTLRNGLDVPVSRTFSRGLRKSGWF
jgi:hypothetical protein